MRIYHFTLIFAVFAVMMLSMAAFSIEEALDDDMRRENLGLLLDRASESAADILKEAHVSGVYGLRDLAVDAFYDSLAAGLGLADGTPARTMLRLYVPVIVVTDGDVMYVCYDEYESAPNGYGVLERKWSDAIDRDASALEETLEYYCCRHNIVAERAGITYSFNIPETEGGMYLRSGEGAGFFVLFQGYPSERADGKTYNFSSFAGTGIDDADRFFINVEGEGYASERFFHREGCGFLSEESIMFGSKKKCALYGAYECPECGD